MSLHFLNAKRLALELQRKEVGPRQRGYYLVAVSLSSLALYYSGLISANPLWSWLSIYEAIVVAIVTVLGIAKAYDAAGGDDNPDFVAQFTCLSLPVFLTTTVAVWACFWAVTLGFRESIAALAESHLQIAVNLSRIGGTFFGLLAFLAIVLSQAIFFYRVVKLLEIVRGEGDDDLPASRS